MTVINYFNNSIFMLKKKNKKEMKGLINFK